MVIQAGYRIKICFLENADYQQNIKHQIEKGPFKQLSQYPSRYFVMNVKNWVENVLFELASKLTPRINDTCHILEIIHD